MTTETQQQQANEQQVPSVLNIPDDAPPAPVDVDMESGEVSEVQIPNPDQKQADQQEQQRTKPRPQARIQNLTHERDQWQGTAQRLEQELQEARRIAQEAQQGREHAERAGMQNLVQRTKAEVSAAKAALKQAKDAGDSDAEVEAHSRLARAAAEEADADAWVAGQPQEQPQQQQRQVQQPQQQRQPDAQPLSGAVRDFLGDNAWFSSVQVGQDGRPIIDSRTGRPVSNPDFDEDMHDVAMIVHKQIAKEIRLGKLPKDYVESPEYFQRIQNKVVETFPDAFDEPAQEVTPPSRKTPQMSQARQPVAPPNRQVPGQQMQKQGEQKMRLDGEEASLVRSLVDNGTMAYPRNHSDPAKRGQKMSYEDAYVKYAREKKADQANRQS